MPVLINPTRNNNNFYYGKKRSKYTNPDACSNLLKYVMRERDHEDRRNELVSVGGSGINYHMPIDQVINQMEVIQNEYDIDKRGGRRMYHEIYSFTEEEFKQLNSDFRNVDMIAREMCKVYFDNGFQVVYAIHSADKVHIHFAINSISFDDGTKFHSSNEEQRLRKYHFDRIFMDMRNIVQEQNYRSNNKVNCPIGFC